MVKSEDGFVGVVRDVSPNASQASSHLANVCAEPISDPALFLLERLHTIALWRLTGRPLNLLQLGSCVVHGVLRRGQSGPHPLDVFELREASVSPPLSAAASSTDTMVTEAIALPGSEEEIKLKSVSAVSHDKTSVAEQARSTSSTASAERHSAHRRHARHRRDGEAAAGPSVARTVLVQCASFAPSDLFMGVLTGLLSRGVPSFYRRDAAAAVVGGGSAASSAQASAHASPELGGPTVRPAAVQRESPLPSALPVHDTNPLSKDETHAHTRPVNAAGVKRTSPHKAGGAAVLNTDGSPRHRLSAEATRALYEIHRAAREITKLIHEDVKLFNALFNKSGTAATEAPSAVKSSRPVLHEPFADAPHGERPFEVQEADLCSRLTFLTANLYSLLALLDFCSVEAGLAEEGAGSSSRRSTPPPPSTQPLSTNPPPSSGHSHTHDKTSDPSSSSSAAAAATTTTTTATTSSNNKKSLLSEFSSAVAAVASAFVDGGAQMSNPALANQTYNNLVAPNGRTHGRTSTEKASKAAPSSLSKSAAAAHAITSTLASSSPSGSHRRSVYTVEHFHKLFDTAGHLPRGVWDILAGVVTVLSQCDVSWSLTHGDASVAASFNATVALVFSEPLQQLLRQLHRLCRRFELLRQRVYGLLPVSPVRFKIKQMLDWSGFLHADDASFFTAASTGADVVDLHLDSLHAVYAVDHLWSITKENAKALRCVAATLHHSPGRHVDATEDASSVEGGHPPGSVTPPTPLPLSAPPSSGALRGIPAPQQQQQQQRGTGSLSKASASSLIAALASAGTNIRAENAQNKLFLSNRDAMTRRTNNNSSSSRVSFPSIAAAASATAAAAGETKRGVVKLSTVPGWVGMRNSGNTCFLNSVVQLLSSAVLFRNDLMSRVQHAVFRRTTSTTTTTAATTSGDQSTIGPGAVLQTPLAPSVKSPDLPALFKQYGCRLALVLLLGELQWRAEHHHEEHAVLPDYLNPQLPVPFNDHRQHDASEFLHALLDQLDEPAQPGGAVVGRWFSGLTATTMTCTDCGHARTHVNAFWDLSTPILETNIAATTVADTSTEGEVTHAQHTGAAVGDSSIAVASVLSDGDAAAAQNVASGETRDAKTHTKVEVEHFAGATATTTTYLSADATTNVPAGSSSSNPVGPHTASTAPVTAVVAGSPAETTVRRVPTLQQLLLHVLHPTLNKELLHGGNALDCEHCRRRTSTELTTQLVAEVAPKRDINNSSSSSNTNNCGEDTSASVADVCPAASPLSTLTSTGGVTPSQTQMDSPTQFSDGNVTAPVGSPAAPQDSHMNVSACLEGSGEFEQQQQQQQQPQDPQQQATSEKDSTPTAAGGGLPWYLAIQLNRFAYQRSTQSFGKITAEVALNEFVLLPAYPLTHTPPPPPPHHTAATSGETDPHNSTDNHHHHNEEQEGHGEQGGASSSAVADRVGVATLPVWVTYRLQTIIVHSGSTPNSGHYFALTRSQGRSTEVSAAAGTTAAAAAHCTNAEAAAEHAQKNEEEAEEGHEMWSPLPPAEPTASSDPCTEVDRARAYAEQFGAAFTKALAVQRVFSTYTAAEQEEQEETNKTHAEDDNSTAAAAGEAEFSAAAVHNASYKPKDHLTNEEATAVPHLEPITPDIPAAINNTTLTISSDEQVGAAVDAHSPLLSPAPTLPHAPVAASGDSFYANWVMLNDSNVEAVAPATMRGILNGDGNRGVYSALETPYLLLYEKVPVCYRDGELRSSEGGEAQQHQQQQQQEGAGEVAEEDANVMKARALQQLWQSPLRDATGEANIHRHPTAHVELAAEAVAVFTARLHEEESKVLTAKAHFPAAPTPSFAGTGAVVPCVPKTGHDTVKVSPIVHTDSHARQHASLAASKADTAHTLHARSRTHSLISTPNASLSPSKRLRAKAALYAQRTQQSKERLSRRRLTRATSASEHADAAADDDDEEVQDADKSGGESSADDAVSLD